MNRITLAYALGLAALLLMVDFGGLLHRRVRQSHVPARQGRSTFAMYGLLALLAVRHCLHRSTSRPVAAIATGSIFVLLALHRRGSLQRVRRLTAPAPWPIWPPTTWESSCLGILPLVAWQRTQPGSRDRVDADWQRALLPRGEWQQHPSRAQLDNACRQSADNTNRRNDLATVRIEFRPSLAQPGTPVAFTSRQPAIARDSLPPSTQTRATHSRPGKPLSPQASSAGCFLRRFRGGCLLGFDGAPALLALSGTSTIMTQRLSRFQATLFTIPMATAHEHDLATLRNAELDALFDIVFSDYEADLSRFPFRAHVFRRSGTFEVEKLEMVYSYRTHSTDPDREISFYPLRGRRGRGPGLAMLPERRCPLLPPRRHCGYRVRVPPPRRSGQGHSRRNRRTRVAAATDDRIAG